MAKRIIVHRPAGMEILGRNQLSFTLGDAKELYTDLSYQLRLVSKKLGGRPRDPDKERCPCGAMTLKRAETLYHKCEAPQED